MPAESDQGEDSAIMFAQYAAELSSSSKVQPLLLQLASGNSVPMVMYTEQWEEFFASLEA